MNNRFPQYQPMRSLIYAHCAKEEYRHKLLHWLYGTHVEDSISQFRPYCSQYAFYEALPVPPEGDRFGTFNMQMTEHYWQVNPLGSQNAVKALTEVFPPEVLVMQGILPELPPGAQIPFPDDNMEGDDARAVRIPGCKPFIYTFIPVWWEEDFKGKTRTLADGPNYRWQFMLKYPEGVAEEDGEKWFYDSLIPYFQKHELVNRILSSKVIREVNGCPFVRVVEIWFDGPEEWYKTVVEDAGMIPTPAWADRAVQDVFPYVEPFYEIAGMFLTDRATSDNYSQYHGYMTMR